MWPPARASAGRPNERRSRSKVAGSRRITGFFRLSCGDSKKVLFGDFGDFYQRGESDCNGDVSSADEYDFYCDEEAGLDSDQVCTIVLVGKSALWDCQNGL